MSGETILSDLITQGFVHSSFFERDQPSYDEIFRTVSQPEHWKPVVTREQAENIINKLNKDRLPNGHTILEQADMFDGRVSQTVRIEATGEEYQRIVHATEAYGEEKGAI